MLLVRIGVKQLVVFIWTLIAVAISLIIVSVPFNLFFVELGQWQLSVMLFFVSLLLLTLPMYLILALWHVLGETSETD